MRTEKHKPQQNRRSVKMEDFSPGFFMPKRPGFQYQSQSGNNVNRSPNGHNSNKQSPRANHFQNGSGSRWHYPPGFVEERKRQPVVNRSSSYHPTTDQSFQRQQEVTFYNQNYQQQQNCKFASPPNNMGKLPDRSPGQMNSSRNSGEWQGAGFPTSPNRPSPRNSPTTPKIICNNQYMDQQSFHPYPQHFIQFESPYNGGFRRKRPTQIPIQCNNNIPCPPSNQATDPNTTWNNRKETCISPNPDPNAEEATHEDQMNGDPSMVSHHPILGNPMVMSMMMPVQLKQEIPSELQMRPQWDMSCQEIPYVNSEYGQINFCEAARQGLSQFHKDFNNLEEVGDVNFVPIENIPDNEKYPFFFSGPPEEEHFFVQELPPVINTPREFNDEVIFDTDSRLFTDPRPIINFVRPGEKEFRLFDCGDYIRSVYNVNDMNIFNPREICSRRLLPKSVVSWPIDLLGSDITEMKKCMLKIPGQTSLNSVHHTLHSILDLSFNDVGARNHSESGFATENSCYSDSGAGPCGLMSLARFVNGEGIDDNPMGFITIMGFNLHKMFKNLDTIGPIIPTFAGPLADRNYSADFSDVEVTKSFEEYNLPYHFNLGDWQGAEMWRTSLRFRKAMLASFVFDTLIYIFYTMFGDALQILAAGELYRRGWRFHKILRVWLTPVASEHEDGGVHWQSGTYKYFNYLNWEFIQAEFRINESLLEGKPHEYTDPLWN